MNIEKNTEGKLLKPKNDPTWINGGFFVLEPEAIDYIDGDMVSW